MSQDSPFIWKSHWKWLGWACKLGGGRVSGNYHDGVNDDCQADRDSDMVSASAHWKREGSTR